MWAVVFVACAVLYGWTASPFIQWQDYGMFVLRAVEGSLVNALGLALSHPIHFWVSRASVAALPLPPAHSVSMVSALFGAVGVANVFGLARQLTGRVAPALLAAAGLALANTYWRMSTMPECYTVTVALLTAELWALATWDRDRRSRWLIAAFFANGLGFSNHNLALLTSPVLGVVAVHALATRRLRASTLLAASAAWLLGASPYLAIIAREAAATGDLEAAVRSALFGTSFRSAVANHSVPLRYTATSLAFTALSFPNLTLPAALVGAADKGASVPVRTRAALLAGLSMHLGFALRYNVIDQYTFLLPAYSIVAVFAALGFDAVRGWPPQRRRVATALAAAMLLATPATYRLAATVARGAHALGSNVRSKPYRDDYAYLLEPWGHDKRSAGRMSAEAVALAGADGLIVVEDEMGEAAVRYEQVQQRRPGIKIVATVGDPVVALAVRRGRVVVLVPARTDRPPAAPPAGCWQPYGALYRLEGVPRPAATTP